MEFLPEFFCKEVRWGFEIPSMMKRAWAAELEVLQVVADICKKYGLQYFADWGTLLGAVRHQGFIPWDDDIDICLKREEYDELIRILPQELPEGFAMAGLYADSDRMRNLAQWLHSRVLVDKNIYPDFKGYLEHFHGFPYTGVGVDIFPLDYLPRDSELAEAQKIMIAYGLSILQNWDILEPDELEKRLSQMEQLSGVSLPRDSSTENALQRLVDSVNALAHEDEADELIGSPFFLNKESRHVKKECYEEAVMLPFEQTEIAVPCRYREVLTALFGDYMIPIQGEQGHTYPFYAPKEKELKRQLEANGFTGTPDEFCQLILRGELQVQML